MIRVRSPFFPLAFASGFLILVGCFLLEVVARRGEWACEPWRDDPATVRQVQSCALALLSVSAPLLLLSVIAHVAHATGWEPTFLHKTLSGVVVVECEPGSGGGWVTVAAPGRQPDRLRCDQAEFALLPLGTVAHVKVVGDRVAGVRTLSGDTADRVRAGIMEPEALRRWRIAGWMQRSGPVGPTMWFLVLVAPLLAARYTAEGLLACTFRQGVEAVGPKYGRIPRLIVGEEALMHGGLTLALALLAASVVGVLWSKGWSDTASSPD